MREHIAHVAEDLDLREPASRPAGLAQALGLAPAGEER